MIQLQFLNKLLRTQDTSLLLENNITEEFFSEYRDEYRWIKNHLDNYGNLPDIESFIGKFPDFDVINVTEKNNYLIDALYEDKNKRALAKVFNKVRDQLNNGETDEALATYLNATEGLLKATHLDTIDILHNTSRYDAYLEKCKDYEKFYVKTGFNELDKLIGGWDRNEELATIAARPGVGKSWVLLKVAIAAAEQGLQVGIYSGEMSENKVGYRIDTLISHISNGQLIHGNSNIQNDYKKYMESLSSKFKGSIKVLTPAMINGPAGVTTLRAFIEKENLDILCVDQHSLLEDDRKARNPVEKAANISRDLKNLQVLKRIPIIAVSQQNRSSTENGVDTSHIAQSDRISQDSTILIFLEQKDNILSLNLVKARDAINNKKISYAIDLDKGIFTFIPEEENSSEEECNNLKQEYDYSNDDEDVF
jgi:replicative DNA helicase